MLSKLFNLCFQTLNKSIVKYTFVDTNYKLILNYIDYEWICVFFNWKEVFHEYNRLIPCYVLVSALNSKLGVTVRS